MVPIELLALYPPLKELGVTVHLIDERLKPDYEEVKKLLKTALLVGISCHPSGQIPNTFKFAEFVRKTVPGVPIVFGGWFPTIVPYLVFKNKAVDFVIREEGEIPLKLLTKALMENGDYHNIPGLCYRDGDRIVCNPTTPKTETERTTIIPYQEIDLEPYIGEGGHLDYSSSRGCPGCCTFCAIGNFYRGNWFPSPANRVVDQISRHVKKHDIASITFVDAEFFLDEQRVRDICTGFLEENLDIKWRAVGSVNSLAGYDSSTWKLLKQSGCRVIETGLESGSCKIRREIRKGLENDAIYRLADTLKQLDITPVYNFILGYPMETLSEATKTFNMIHDLKAHNPKSEFAIYRCSPIPGTDLCRDLIKSHPFITSAQPAPNYLSYLPSNSLFWLPPAQARTIDMVFYFYLPLSLRADIPVSFTLKGIARFFASRIAKKRLQKMFIKIPFEWWTFLALVKMGILSDKRFKRWAAS